MNLPVDSGLKALHARDVGCVAIFPANLVRAVKKLQQHTRLDGSRFSPVLRLNLSDRSAAANRAVPAILDARAALAERTECALALLLLSKLRLISQIFADTAAINLGGVPYLMQQR